MNITIKLEGDADLLARFTAWPAVVAAALYAKMQWAVLRVEGVVKQKLSGQLLQVGKNRPGHTGGTLRSSIGGRVDKIGELTVIGTIFSANVPYARIQEEGGHTSAHIILPKQASVLAFTKAGADGTGFAKYVNHPGSTIKGVHYMKSSLTELSQEISLGLKAAVVEGLMKK